MNKGPADVLLVRGNADQLCRMIGFEIEPLVLSEENIVDVLVDLVKKSGLVNGEVFQEIGLYDRNEFTLTLNGGQSFTITAKENSSCE